MGNFINGLKTSYGKMSHSNVWQNDASVSGCTHCGVTFSFMVRRHHCRECGMIFCNRCSFVSNITQVHGMAVRICALCCADRHKFVQDVRIVSMALELIQNDINESKIEIDNVWQVINKNGIGVYENRVYDEQIATFGYGDIVMTGQSADQDHTSYDPYGMMWLKCSKGWIAMDTDSLLKISEVETQYQYENNDSFSVLDAMLISQTKMLYIEYLSKETYFIDVKSDTENRLIQALQNIKEQIINVNGTINIFGLRVRSDVFSKFMEVQNNVTKQYMEQHVY